MMIGLRTWGCRLVLAVAVLQWAGCRSCERDLAPPPLLPEQGQLPKPPVAAESPAAVAAPASPPPPGCVVILTPDVERGPAPLEVRFTAEGLCSDAPGEFDWDFGDGSPPLTGMKPEQPPDKADYAFVRAQHTYAKPGEYIAKVTLRDPTNNVSDVDEYPITVEGP
ncbi:MAG: PKD domain-containing protein [Candidatus Binatia bacterium]|nr:PKD domain-containing protein [Candidatus Binatia bacterium]